MPAGALFFPDVDLPPLRLARTLLFFDRIILYRLPLDQPGRPLLEAEAEGRLLRPIATFFEDEAELKSVLAGFNRLTEYYPEPGSLSLLKNLDPEDEESSINRLRARLKEGRSGPEERDDPRRTAQVWLTLARDLDRKRQEVEVLLAEVEKNESELAGVMGVEPDEETGPPPQVSILEPSFEEETREITSRLAAWVHFYLACGPPGTPLLTDRPGLLAEMDQTLARGRASARMIGESKTEVLEPLLEIALPLPADPGSSPAEGLARIRRPAWSAFLAKASAKAWARSELPELRREAAAVAAGLTAGASKPAGPVLILSGYLLPGSEVKGALAAAAGLTESAGEPDLFCGPVFELASRLD
ncbi:MAG: hypothetical protein AB1641_01010 [Thermodesulfobacteriota bacterium]